jgi:peroxiredoxin
MGQALALRDRADEFTVLNTQIAGAGFSSVAENALLGLTVNISYDLLCDESRQLAVAYEACLCEASTSLRPISYLIDEQGVILGSYTNVGADADMDDVLRDVRKARG